MSMMILLLMGILLMFPGCQKENTFEKMRPYYDEILEAKINNEYPGVFNVGIEAIEAGNGIDFKISIQIDENNSNAQDSVRKLKEKYGDILKTESDPAKKYTDKELSPYLEEIRKDFEKGKYPGLVTWSTLGRYKIGQIDDRIIVVGIDIKNDKAVDTAKSLKQKYGDMVEVRICSIVIAQ